MFGKFFEWVNGKKESSFRTECNKYKDANYGNTLYDTSEQKSKGTEEIMQKIRLEHENEVSSENPYYFSETTSDRKYYD